MVIISKIDTVLTKMTLSEYSNLKRQIVVAFGNKDTHKDLLKTVKDIFDVDINSVRRFENIQTIGQLLKTLELRGLLWEDNIQPLKDIANAIESYDLLRKLTSYEESYIPRDYSNVYVSEKANKSNSTEKPFQSGISKETKDRITKIVIEEIGIYWRDLARYLRIRECVIDDIEFSTSTLAMKAKRMMLQYETSVLYDPQNWHHNLCDALEKIQRKDILRSVKKIMMMNL